MVCEKPSTIRIAVEAKATAAENRHMQIAVTLYGSDKVEGLLPAVRAMKRTHKWALRIGTAILLLILSNLLPIAIAHWAGG